MPRAAKVDRCAVVRDETVLVSNAASVGLVKSLKP